MKEELLNMFSDFKQQIINKITELKSDVDRKCHKEFQILPESDSNIVNIETIGAIEYDKEENVVYVNNLITNGETLEADEYWTPLDQLSFDELFEIINLL